MMSVHTIENTGNAALAVVFCRNASVSVRWPIVHAQRHFGQQLAPIRCKRAKPVGDSVRRRAKTAASRTAAGQHSCLAGAAAHATMTKQKKKSKQKKKENNGDADALAKQIQQTTLDGAAAARGRASKRTQ